MDTLVDRSFRCCNGHRTVISSFSEVEIANTYCFCGELATPYDFPPPGTREDGRPLIASDGEFTHASLGHCKNNADAERKQRAIIDKMNRDHSLAKWSVDSEKPRRYA